MKKSKKIQVKTEKAPVQRTTRWAGLCALFFLSAFLLWVPPTGYSSIVGPKHTLFLWACGIYFVLALVFSLYEKHNPQWLPLGLAGALILWILLSAAFSEHQDVVWVGSKRHEGFITLALYLCLFAAMSLWGKLGKAHVYAAALSSLCMLILAALQFAGLNPLGLYPSGYTFHDRGILYSGEYLSTIGNSDLLSAVLTVLFLFQAGSYAAGKNQIALPGAFCAALCLMLSEVTAGPVAIAACLALALPACLYWGIGGKRLFDVAAAFTLAALVKACLGYSYDEKVLHFYFQFGPIPAALCVIFAACILLRILFRPGPKRKTALGIVIAYALLIAAVLLFLFFYSGTNPTLQGLHLLLHGNPPDSLGSSRIRIWKEAWQLGLEKPILGSGPDTYRFRSNIRFETLSPAGKLLKTGVDVAHCEYLNLWVCCGLPAMVLMLALVLACVAPALRRPRNSTLPLLLPALGYAIHALFGISQSVASPLFYIFLGALVYAQNLREKE